MNYSEIWFDQNTGELIDTQNTETAQEITSATVVPLESILFSDDFPFRAGDFDRIHAHDITADDAVVAGRGIARVFRSPDGPRALRDREIERLNILGILPDMNFIKRRFGKLSTYCDLIGVPKSRDTIRFNEISTTEFLELIMREHASIAPDYPITQKEIYLLHADGRLPNFDYIVRRVGNINELNELLGYPDIKAWDLHDYVEYGARVLKLNGLDSLTARNLDKLARRRLGPSRPTVVERFGNLTTFKNLAIEELQRHLAIDKARSEKIESHIEQMSYPDAHLLTTEQKAHIWAKYHVAQDTLPGLPSSKLTEIALQPNGKFVAVLMEYKPGLTIVDIELTALSLSVTEDIWPPRYKREPIID